MSKKLTVLSLLIIPMSLMSAARQERDDRDLYDENFNSYYDAYSYDRHGVGDEDNGLFNHEPSLEEMGGCSEGGCSADGAGGSPEGGCSEGGCSAPETGGDSDFRQERVNKSQFNYKAHFLSHDMEPG